MKSQEACAQPFLLHDGGTLTAEQSKSILKLTGVKCSVRHDTKARRQTSDSRLTEHSRELTMHGKEDHFKTAHGMALMFIEENGKTGGRKSKEEQIALQAELKRSANKDLNN